MSRQFGSHSGSLDEGLADTWLPGGPYPAVDQYEFDAWEQAQVERAYSRVDSGSESEQT